MVKSFLHEAVSSGLSLKGDGHFSLDGQNRKLTLVQAVDEKLLQMTSQEKGNVGLLGLIGEIKGLLINLYQ